MGAMYEMTARQYGLICDLIWRVWTEYWEGYGEIFHTSQECRRVANIIEDILEDDDSENFLLIDHNDEV